jgi:hypothetical protein
MLHPEPASRATMAAIMAHPWFKVDLDPRVMTMHLQALAQRQGQRPVQQPHEIAAVVQRVREGAQGLQHRHMALG